MVLRSMLLVNQYFLFLAAIINFVLGAVIYLRKKRSIVNLTFAILAFDLGLWSLATVLIYIYPHLFWLNSFIVFFGFSLVTTFLLFIRNFPTPPHKNSVLFYFFLITWQIFVTIESLLPNWYFEEMFIKDGFPRVEKGLGYEVTSIVFIPYVLYFFYLLGTKYINAKGPEKMQMKYLFLGIASFSLIAILLSLVLVSLNINFMMDLSPSFSIVMLGFIAYAVVKHRLMDIRLAVARSVAYSFLVAIIAGFFVFTISYLRQFYQGFMSQNMAFIIAGFVAAFGFQPLRRFLEKATDRIFAKGRYDFKELLRKLGEIFSTKVILEDLTKATLKTLTKEMRFRRAAFIVLSNPKISKVKQIGYKGVSKYNWEKAVSLAKNKREMIVADELEEGSNEKELLRKLNTEVLLPLATENEMVGLLALGEKSSGDMFTSEDLKLLAVIAPQAAIALKNAARQKGIINQLIEERERIQKKAQQKIYLKLESLAGEAEQSLNKPLLKRKKALFEIEGGLRKAVSELQEIVLGTS